LHDYGVADLDVLARAALKSVLDIVDGLGNCARSRRVGMRTKMLGQMVSQAGDAHVIIYGAAMRVHDLFGRHAESS